MTTLTPSFYPAAILAPPPTHSPSSISTISQKFQPNHVSPSPLRPQCLRALDRTYNKNPTSASKAPSDRPCPRGHLFHSPLPPGTMAPLPGLEARPSPSLPPALAPQPQRWESCLTGGSLPQSSDLSSNVRPFLDLGRPAGTAPHNPGPAFPLNSSLARLRLTSCIG